MTPSIFIIIPTYNEKKNIETIILQILSLSIHGLSIVIVDDNSPDGTGKIADELSNKFPHIHVIHRTHKQGLGPAYVTGFRFALEHNADVIFEMDADGSHDPKKIRGFLLAIKQYDVVLGSRYVPNGGTKNWGIVRKAVSYFGNFYARMVLGVTIRDLTGGFKCYRRNVLEKINISELSSLGYVFQIETTYKALKAGYSVAEIPIIFTERSEGKSKFSLGIFLGAFIKVLMLRSKI